MPTVYFHTSWGEDPVSFLEAIAKQTPGKSGMWGDIRGVADSGDADYHVAFNQTSPELDSNRLFVFSSEPPVSHLYDDLRTVDCLRSYPIDQYYKPQRWWIDCTYDILVDLEPPEKSSDLSWITTSKGRNVGQLGQWTRRLCRRLGIDEHRRQSVPIVNKGGTDGHVLRMQFLDELVANEPEMLDLYGRGEFSGTHYRGEIEDKWEGLVDYRYSLAIENYSGPNYFSEKLTDVLLTWCMPIYWGCTNLGEYLPEDSFVWLDIEDEHAPKRVRDIVTSNLRERNLDAIAEARQLLLNEYQLWPTVEKAITTVST